MGNCLQLPLSGQKGAFEQLYLLQAKAYLSILPVPRVQHCPLVAVDGYLKHVPELLARRPVLCYFPAQTFDGAELWQPRRTEIHARRRLPKLSRSPLRLYSRLIHEWGLTLFVSRRYCPAKNSEFLAETWELQGLL